MEEGLLKRGQYDLIYVECVLSQKKTTHSEIDKQVRQTIFFLDLKVISQI